MEQTEEQLLAEWLKNHNYVPIINKVKITRKTKVKFSFDSEGKMIQNGDEEISLDIEIDDDETQHKFIDVNSEDYVNLLNHHYYALLKDYMILFSVLNSEMRVFKQLQW